MLTVLALAALPMVSTRLHESPWSPIDGPTSVSLTATPPVVATGGDVVISWSNIDQHPKDYVTLTCGPTTGPNDFIAARNVSGSFVRFEDLYMLRCDYEAHYYHFVNDAFAHVSDIVIPLSESKNAPKHGHLSFNDGLNQMVISFNSASTTTPMARYGKSRTLDDHLVRFGSTTTYTAEDMCHAPATTMGQTLYRHPGYFHSVVMDNLEPATEYFYQFGNDVDGWSDVASFVSRVTRGDETPVSFIAYADMGVDDAPRGWSTALRVFEDVVARGYNHFLLHFGDISYARGNVLQWDKFFALLEPLATRMYVPAMHLAELAHAVRVVRTWWASATVRFFPNHGIGSNGYCVDEFDYTSGGDKDPSQLESFHPAWGNYGADSSGECGVPMVHRFHAPTNGRGLFWYSFDYGLVHVVQMSSEHDFLPGSLQHTWLEKTLAAVDRRQTPWVVLTAHRMMYTTQIGEAKDLRVSRHFRAAVEPLLRQHRVNLVLAGHQHSYERSCPVFNGTCVDQGTVHMVVGSAGAELEQQGFSPEIGPWSVANINAYGYLRGRISRDRMHLEFVLNANGNVYDQVDLLPWA
ncbi:calcineurin-like phosphoesterase [Achlya hypogyna]|uniref:Purple acid phosphatase n=1 Tax=Achlya hypogyna TaxID=1202772 RepID=A0A1V9Z2Q4_ACHHY|nr:calcineurin-like phosphoesterase [Achlya hypogyna]